ncbi:hypothetical protein M3223_19000 [Paenibacillus pasadenensis]|uniref:hypothetical protein n=1 Tax=Paenibacillus pasadenensis TaxID=217090 RepID=UPI00203EF1DE|nr:hypothetical protein [Paenibacillus pasadenensis]MCM3749444.1 hypothetical protein [Paenibacillus pasadenensis]
MNRFISFPINHYSLLIVSVVLAGCFALLFSPSISEAASLEISPSAQTGFEKAVAKADSATADRLNRKRQEYSALLQRLSDSRSQSQNLHADALKLSTAVRQASASIDSEAIRAQESRVAKAKSVYEPMYAGYTALNKRIRAAAGSSKEAAKALRMQADTMQAAVQLARQSLRLQQEQLKKLKSERTAKITAIRKTLSGMDSLNDAQRVRKSSARIPEAALKDALKDFSAAARKGESALMERSLSAMVDGGRRLLKQWEEIVEQERRYLSIAEQARSQLAGFGVKIS